MTTIAAELQQLYRSGNTQIPLIAIAYATASNTIANTSGGTLNTKNGTEYGDALAGFHTEFIRWKDYVQNAFSVTADNLESTGKALCDIAEHYAYEDEEAAESFPNLEEDFKAKIEDDKDSPVYSDPGPIPESDKVEIEEE